MGRLRVFLGLVAVSTAVLAAAAPGSTAAADVVAHPGEAFISQGKSACSSAVRRRRAAALRRYRRNLPAARRAYFRRHRSGKARRTFVRRQNAKLKGLRRSLAACSARRRTDLSIVFTESPASGAPRLLRYQATATNRGPLGAAQVNIFVGRSAGTQLVTATGPGRCQGQTIASCDVGALAVGQSKTVEVVLRPLAEGRVSVEAEVLAYDLDDLNQANNRTTAVAELRPPAPSCPPLLWPGFGGGQLSEGDPGEVHSGHPSTGTAPALMLFVDYSNAPAGEPTAPLYQDLVPEADRLFRQVSYGRFGLEVLPIHRWIRMPSLFGSYSTRTLIRDAVEAVDAEIDFRRYRMVYAVSPSTSDTTTSAYIVSLGDGVLADGVEIRHGAVIGGDVLRTRGGNHGARVLLHETGHALGLPDLYDQRTADLHRFVGSWDPMGSIFPMHDFLAWHKWKLGWLDASQVACLAGPGVVEETLTPVAGSGGVKTIVALDGSSRAIVAEARRRVGEDASLCEEGVLVYSVDARVGTGHGPVQVRPAQPGGASPHCGNLGEAPFDVGPDEVARFEDAAAGVTVEVLSSSPDGYRVRVTKH